MIKAGCPWLLTFELKRSQQEDLLNVGLQNEFFRLLELGAFESVGMAPVCASFSRAVAPAVRTASKPRGLPGLTVTMRRKVLDGNHMVALFQSTV